MPAVGREQVTLAQCRVTEITQERKTKNHYYALKPGAFQQTRPGFVGAEPLRKQRSETIGGYYSPGLTWTNGC
jgi:hypothetical protein